MSEAVAESANDGGEDRSAAYQEAAAGSPAPVTA